VAASIPQAEQILSELGWGDGPGTPGELAARLKLPGPSVRRVLAGLLARGAVVRSDAGVYTLRTPTAPTSPLPSDEVEPIERVRVGVAGPAPAAPDTARGAILRVLRAVSPDAEGLTSREVADAAGLAYPTTRARLSELVRGGEVVAVDGRYSLSDEMRAPRGPVGGGGGGAAAGPMPKGPSEADQEADEGDESYEEEATPVLPLPGGAWLGLSPEGRGTTPVVCWPVDSGMRALDVDRARLGMLPAGWQARYPWAPTGSGVHIYIPDGDTPAELRRAHDQRYQRASYARGSYQERVRRGAVRIPPSVQGAFRRRVEAHARAIAAAVRAIDEGFESDDDEGSDDE